MSEEATFFGESGGEAKPPGSKTEKIFSMLRQQQKALNEMSQTSDRKDKIQALSDKNSISFDLLLKLVGLSSAIITILGALMWVLFFEPRVDSKLDKRFFSVEKKQEEFEKKLETHEKSINNLETNDKLLDYKINKKNHGRLTAED